MFASKDGGDREEAQRAVIMICTRFAEYDHGPEPVLAVYDTASAEEKAVLLPLLGRIGGAEGLRADPGGDRRRRRQWREVGLSALCNWPNAHAADDLLKLAETAKDKDHRRRFLRAFAQVVAIRSDGTPPR